MADPIVIVIDPNGGTRMVEVGRQGPAGPAGADGPAGPAGPTGPEGTGTIPSARTVVTYNVPDLEQFNVLNDGITHVEGDSVLLVNQDIVDDNGPYVVGVVSLGAAELTPRDDFDEWTDGASIQIREGTNAPTLWFFEGSLADGTFITNLVFAQSMARPSIYQGSTERLAFTATNCITTNTEGSSAELNPAFDGSTRSIIPRRGFHGTISQSGNSEFEVFDFTDEGYGTCAAAFIADIVISGTELSRMQSDALLIGGTTPTSLSQGSQTLRGASNPVTPLWIISGSALRLKLTNAVAGSVTFDVLIEALIVQP